ncbi:lipoyl domain-containing protein [Fusibacter paucivorans]|uniref:Lipoyl domain-containing protein n=1 Tax=Fusibacter paucivorans TaxID=76009 RepID=A0ABS5PTS9_9FIRM|nr:lipoyl domain-containing protein [Fusibacter paucivorans]MBS7528578.1 lipoyl domain-containing protein [Fusibacter paucivorans]
MEQIFMANLGMTMQEGKVKNWLVEDGSEVTKGQEVVELADDTEKLVKVIEAPASGKIKILLPANGSLVACGEPIAEIE